MGIPIFQVDAFTGRLFSGNPAAVCPLESWPDDGLMQAIAAENNLSETAFFVRETDGYRLRWFTPLIEVDLCGHATLAAAFVILNHLEPGRDDVVFSTRSGELRVSAQGGLLRMDFPALPPVPCDGPADLLTGLGTAPLAVLRSPSKYLAVFATEEDVLDLRPDSEALERLDLMGVIVTAPGRSHDFVSRMFAPKVGIPEDPVTGSAHSVLTPYWAARLGKTELSARQVSRRGGELLCSLRGDRVDISGHAVLFMRGEIALPGA